MKTYRIFLTLANKIYYYRCWICGKCQDFQNNEKFFVIERRTRRTAKLKLEFEKPKKIFCCECIQNIDNYPKIAKEMSVNEYQLKSIHSDIKNLIKADTIAFVFQWRM
jgi:hypothetical protein